MKIMCKVVDQDLTPFQPNCFEIAAFQSVVKFQSWALFTNFKSKNWNEVGRDLREDCCE